MIRKLRHLRTAMLLREVAKIERPARIVWAAKRADGKYWMGPWHLRGNAFTTHEPRAYKWGTRVACESAILWDGLLDAEPVPMEFRPPQRR